MTGRHGNDDKVRTLIRDHRAALGMTIADLTDLLDDLPDVDAETREMRMAWKRFLRAWSRALEARLLAAASGEPATC
jgi:DNA-binding transcriptional MerR regulator